MGSVKYFIFPFFLLDWVTNEKRNNRFGALNFFNGCPVLGQCVLLSMFWDRVKHTPPLNRPPIDKIQRGKAFTLSFISDPNKAGV